MGLGMPGTVVSPGHILQMGRIDARLVFADVMKLIRDWADEQLICSPMRPDIAVSASASM
jgi:hypothetical protein